MATEVERIIRFATGELGSSYWHGYCQAFISQAYEAGIGRFIACTGAKDAEQRYMLPGTADDLTPPAGAALYFTGDGEKGRIYGHTALSIGNGKLIDPVEKVRLATLTPSLHNGYHGWGWFGGRKPQGASSPQENKKTSGSSSGSSSGGSSSSGSSKPVLKEIESVRVVSASGAEGARAADRVREVRSDGLCVAVQNGREIFLPVLTGEVRLTSRRGMSASSLEFHTAEELDGLLENGCPVAFTCRGVPMFYGYIFSIERRTRERTTVVCYDQMRYFKNKDSFVYHLSYSELVRYVAQRYAMQTGTIEDTGYVIPTRVEENTIFDILATAADLTAAQNGTIYVLYDDFGKLTLKSVENMRTDLCIDMDAVGKFSIGESIDSGVYDRIVLARDNRLSGERELFVANDAEKQSKWGVLQYYEKVDEDEPDESIRTRVQQMLQSYRVENKTLTVKNCIGYPLIRGGSGLIVHIQERGLKNYMICEKVEHRFMGNRHLMDLELSGGGFRV